MGRVLKLVAGNLLVFFVIVVLGNAITAGIYDLLDEWDDLRDRPDERLELPNFVDKERSRRVFSETRLLETAFAPFVGWTRKPFRGETVNVDERGDRIHEAPGSGARGHVRFFGGSTTWGTGVDDDHTIPALFNDRYPDWTVHNHGESGFHSRQELARLINLLQVEEPVDLVVFYDGYNDVRNLCQQDVELTGHARQAEMAARLEAQTLFWRMLTAGLGTLIHDLRKDFGRLAVRPSRCVEDETYGDRIAKMLLANWRTARELSVRAGADFLAFLQPVAAIGSPNLSHLADDAFSLDDYSALHHSKLGRGVDARIVYPRIQAEIERAGADWIHDLTEAFDGDELIYMGPVHVTENGNAIIAERIGRVAGPLLEARTRARSRG